MYSKYLKYIQYLCITSFFLLINIQINFLQANNKNSYIKVHFIDVGQGDSILINLFSKKYILIDSGPPEKFYYFYKYFLSKKGLTYFLSKKKIKYLDYFIMSHAHLDHIGNLKRLLKSIKIKEFWDPGFAFPLTYYKYSLKLIEKKDIIYKIVRQGFRININGVLFEVLSPKNLIKYTRNNVNNNSIVVKMTYKNISFLFTGDIEVEAEWELLKLKNLLKSSILKSPHHGSNTSNSRKFLKLVNPELAIISCGKMNMFGHPAPETLNLYDELGIKFYRTDKNGTISIITDGLSYKVVMN